MSAVGPRAAAFVGVALLLTACGSGDTPSPSPSTTAAQTTASASPTATEPGPVAPSGRNRDMDAEEASLRASQVPTGEEWLDKPVTVTTPDWADADVFWSDDYLPLEWYRIGTRDGNEILQHGLAGEIVEVAADGTPTWIPFPFPWQEVVALDCSPEIDADTDVYYDSLAAAATVHLNGLVLGMHGPTVPEVGAWSTAKIATVDSWAIDRFTQDVYPSWGEAADWSAYVEGLENVAFGRRPPTGGWYDAPPIRPAWDDIAWEDGYGTVEGAFVDLFDVACGPVQTLTWNILLDEPDMADWTLAGTVDGFPVYAMDPASDLASLMYDYYALNPNQIALDPDATGLSSTEYARAPAVLAVPAGDGSGWWLLLDQSLSLRAWC